MFLIFPITPTVIPSVKYLLRRSCMAVLDVYVVVVVRQSSAAGNEPLAQSGSVLKSLVLMHH